MERQALADRTAYLMRGVAEDLPSVFSARERLNAWLADEVEAQAELSVADVERLELHRAMGVA